jgi:pentatricopeptide repeat protein
MPASKGRADGHSRESAETSLPRINLGPHSISRLICGSNPFNAGSHLSTFVNREMRQYYSADQIVKTLGRCQEVGINCWQSVVANCELYRRFIDEGGQMHYISLTADDPACLTTLAEAGCIGVAFHGEVADGLLRNGRFDEAHDYLKRIRDSGMLVGVATHMPAVVEAVESKGWDVDFYMTCVYERHRSAAELEKMLGHVPICPGEVYLSDDPPRMFKVMRQTTRPCLAFKILAAGRLSDRPEWVEQAFRDTFQSIKPNDAAIVGIYDRYSDQPAECAELVRRFGGSARGG